MVQNTAASVPVTTGGRTLLQALPAFRRSLAATNKRPRTIEGYCDAVERLHRFLAERGMPTAVESIRREYVEAFVEDQLARLSPATARIRFASLRAFFRWAHEDLELISTNPMARLRQPKVVAHPVEVLSEDELRALVRTTEADKTFEGRRDAAIVRVFVNTGARLSEVAGLRVDDLDQDSGVIHFTTTKGGRVRSVAIASRTIVALDRYLAKRDGHRFASSEALWLGRLGPLKTAAVADALERRGQRAGVTLHPHTLRHTAAHHLRLAGIDDDALMRLMGWTDRSMLNRYGASASEERALDAARRVGFGDRF